MEDGSVRMSNPSPMYPKTLEDRINALVGKKITLAGPMLGGFFGSFINSFYIPKEHIGLFDEVAPEIFGHNDNGYFIKDEVAAANMI